VKLEPFKGWLLDAYPSEPGKVTVWVIKENGERIRLEDEFKPKLYVSGFNEDLTELTNRLTSSESVASWRFVEKYADFMRNEKSKVLEIDVTDCRRTPFFARKILRLGGYRKFRLHNVDIPDVQEYFYQKDIFPLAFLAMVNHRGRIAYWLLDSVESVDYKVPPLRIMSMRVNIAKREAVANFNDPIESIVLKQDGETVEIDGGDEKKKILALVKAVREKDPDIILTRGGDYFLFPYLARRALVNGILNELVLGREEIPLRAKKRKGITFFSYGRVYFKAPLRRLYGRIHIDEENTFIYKACGLEGLIEVSRTCRVPLHRAARASIGTIMSSLQLYQAYKDGILIPWKKREPESYKSASELLVADRGGFIFEPKLGIHDDVVEVDFASMYPTLMAMRNISAETVLCKCCPDSQNRVPELNYNICEKREGLVPKTLKIILRKRFAYKRMRNEATDPKLKKIYDDRQNALKWILVTCFGYLGYRNARFGRVDAHIAVCAFARDALLRTVRIAEERGFEVVHGIVDSLWLKKREASPREYVELCDFVSREIGVPLNVEGSYRWIVFLPSKIHKEVPVLNRYYGVFETGKIKVRGIEAARRDTPEFIKRAQVDMIRVLARARNSEAFMRKIPEAIEVLRRYAERLRTGKVDAQDLLITKHLSMRPERYVHDVFQALAAKQLMKLGLEVTAGQAVRYLITDAENRKPQRRVRVAELIDENTRYDVREYMKLLIAAAESVLAPFGWSFEKLFNTIIYNEKQELLMAAR
jgi:DNA polymerase elongation subunit (family B)